MKQGLGDAQLHVIGEAASFASALHCLVRERMSAGMDKVMIGETVLGHDFVQRLRAKVALIVLLYHAATSFLI